MKRTIAIILLISILLLVACTPSNKEKFEIAGSFIGRQSSELTEEIGMPNRVSYASSCQGDGLDGELYYNTFIVYVYRDTDGTETIYDVMELPMN